MFSFLDSPAPPAFGKKLIALTLILSLGGCSSIRDDSTRTRTEGGLAGAAGGAALGAGVGALVGGKNKSKAAMTGAAIGAAAGGLGGLAYGDSVARKKEGHTRTEDALDARLRTTQRQVGDLRTYNLGLQYQIARHQQSLASAQSANRAAGRAVEQFEVRSLVATRISEVDRRTRSWQETIDAHKAALRQFGGDPRSATLRTSIQELSAQQSELRRHGSELRSMVRRAR